MSVHARYQQRIASTCAHRTVLRRRQQQQQCVRSYASDTASEPEWFQKVRDDLLGRRPRCHPEALDATHHDRFNTTLQGFAPITHAHGHPNARVPLAELLTRFNVHVPSSELLRDGTDPLHSPGGPWLRRLWAGGAVKVRPAQPSGAKAGTVAPFRLSDTVACLERIKHVRLHGAGDEAKVHVTIERCFAPSRDSKAKSGRAESTKRSRRVRLNLDRSASPVTEERNLVFMKAKTGAELLANTNGQTRYLKAPEDPDYSHSLTPTPSLLFRYSAITYNAHLLHTDPAYARDVEGHRNMLVHGPLTLTLMLQALHTHLKPTLHAVTSIEYRNIAPLYCDEAMRICVKKKRKKQTDTGHSWDVWIEGPTGGMAVKAVARSSPTHQSATKTPANEPIPVSTQRHPQRIGVALRYLYLQSSSPLVNTAVVDREVTQPATPTPDPSYIPPTPFSKKSRKRSIGAALPYLYAHNFTPLVNRNVVARTPPPSSTPASTSTSTSASTSTSTSASTSASTSPPTSTPTIHHFTSKAGVISTRTSRGIQTKEYFAARRRRAKGIRQGASGEASPAEEDAVFGFLDTGDVAREIDIVRMAGERRKKRRGGGVRKVEGFKIRGISGERKDGGVGFRKGQRRGAWERAVAEGVRRKEERERERERRGE